ncbi:hypothetical protein GF327_07490 [Candidatus Woesearchaeota archaeon]|nr:hypothetical protein [Candidatus Woesearchaeota archaeon]
MLWFFRINMRANIRFHPIAWTSKIGKKRATYHISINKLVARGVNLEKEDVLHSYVGEDHNKRPIMITYLDKEPRIFSNKPLDRQEE